MKIQKTNHLFDLSKLFKKAHDKIGRYNPNNTYLFFKHQKRPIIFKEKLKIDLRSGKFITSNGYIRKQHLEHKWKEYTSEIKIGNVKLIEGIYPFSYNELEILKHKLSVVYLIDIREDLINGNFNIYRIEEISIKQKNKPTNKLSYLFKGTIIFDKENSRNLFEIQFDKIIQVRTKYLVLTEKSLETLIS
jgi:hypothetical protein